MSDSLVLLDTKDRVATITINNAEKRNPLNLPTVEALIAALQSADADEEVLAIVLTGAGDRAFCAGGDLKAGADGGPFTGDISQPGHFVVGLFSLMEKCNKPIIGRINGHAMGGGAGLVCACDIAVMVSTAKIATPEVKLGLFPMMIMPQMMKVIPRRRLLEMYITGEPWSAQQALEYGIVNYVTEPHALDAKVNELAGMITARSPSAVRLGKYSYHAIQDMTIEQQFRFAETMLPRIAMTQDAREGFSAFLEKRVPNWTGR
ncbi:MAG: enoyl-CoA hydratase-related protein [Parvibaculum sedimenti]|uniref:enoyl-CoA hydratase-related protein n=1 Tax=Parvibaculum sedimenti TaxID=2608632 RepID=UPI003BB57BB3